MQCHSEESKKYSFVIFYIYIYIYIYIFTILFLRNKSVCMTKEKNGAVIHRSWIDSFLAGFLLLMQNCMRIPRLFADRDDIRIRYDIASSVKTKHNPPMVQKIFLAKFKFRLLCSSMLLY